MTRKQKGGVKSGHVLGAVAAASAVVSGLNPQTTSHHVSNQLQERSLGPQHVQFPQTNSIQNSQINLVQNSPGSMEESNLLPQSQAYELEGDESDLDEHWGLNIKSPVSEVTQTVPNEAFFDNQYVMHEFKLVNDVLKNTRAPPKCKESLDLFRNEIKDVLQSLFLKCVQLHLAYLGKNGKNSDGSEKFIFKDLEAVNALLSKTHASHACKPYLDTLRLAIKNAVEAIVQKINFMQKKIKAVEDDAERDKVPEI